MLAVASKITDLSFAESGTRLWCPQRIGDYARDTALGRYYARELLDYIKMKHCPLAYSQVVRAIIEGGVYGPVEIGFSSVIGIQLIGVGTTYSAAA